MKSESRKNGVKYYFVFCAFSTLTEDCFIQTDTPWFYWFYYVIYTLIQLFRKYRRFYKEHQYYQYKASTPYIVFLKDTGSLKT